MGMEMVSDGLFSVWTSIFRMKPFLSRFAGFNMSLAGVLHVTVFVAVTRPVPVPFY